MKLKVGKTATVMLLSAGLLAGSLSLPQSSVFAAEQTAQIQASVNMRTKASTSSTVIRNIKQGEQVTVIDDSNSYWFKVIDSTGKTGYISSSSKYSQLLQSGTDNRPSINVESSKKGNGQAGTSASVEKIIAAGMKYLGTPYEYGSNRKSTRTFDCSAFVQRVFSDALNLKIPSNSRAQGTYVKNKGNNETKWSNLKRGDLMFFMSYKGSSASSYSRINKSKQSITHVGIYLGDGKILHTYSKESGGVTTSKIAGTHWEYRFLYGGSAL